MAQQYDARANSLPPNVSILYLGFFTQATRITFFKFTKCSSLFDIVFEITNIGRSALFKNG